MLESLKNKLYQRHLRKRLKTDVIDRESNVSFTEAESIGILFDGTDIANFGSVRKYAEDYKKKGKKVKLLAYIDSKNPNPELGYPYFSKKDLNWYYKPSSALVDEFINRKFDILVNAYLEEKLPLLYISTFAKANLRVGLYFPEHTDASDMMITVRSEQSINNFFEEINHYLNIFSKASS